MSNIKKDEDILSRISEMISQAREQVAAAINEQMVILYWDIGKVIKEDIIILHSWRGEFKNLNWFRIRGFCILTSKHRDRMRKYHCG